MSLLTGELQEPRLRPALDVADGELARVQFLELGDFNINFDEVTLDAMLRRHGLMPRWDYHLIDLPSMALGWLHGRAHESGLFDFREAAQLPYRSYELSSSCDVEPPSEDERHTAMGDADWVMRWHDALTYRPFDAGKPFSLGRD